MMRKIICAVLALFIIFGCASCAAQPGGGGGEKLQIVASLFPQYDFARKIAGDRAEVTLLLPAGMESHTYDPTPADMARISGCDLFIYTGEYMEPWAAELASGLDAGKVLDVSAGIELSGEHDHEDGEAHSPDPHIWTSPLNAKKMAKNIRDALIAADPDGESEYTDNAAEYLEKLDELDRKFRDIAAESERNILVFGGRFAFHYLAEEYGFDCRSAYDSCAAETEPSAAAVAELIEVILREKVPVVFCEEFANPQVAQAIADETGAELRVLHSCHNLSAEERERGETYLTLMERNAENIRAALGPVSLYTEK